MEEHDIITGHHKYTWSDRFGSIRHNWDLVGSKGALNFHISIMDNDRYPPTAGLEIHYCNPPEYMKNNPPSFTNCELTGGRCWHDGTSLYATEHLWPMIKAFLKSGDHRLIFTTLDTEYKSRFQNE